MDLSALKSNYIDNTANWTLLSDTDLQTLRAIVVRDSDAAQLDYLSNFPLEELLTDYLEVSAWDLRGGRAKLLRHVDKALRKVWGLSSTPETNLSVHMLLRIRDRVVEETPEVAAPDAAETTATATTMGGLAQSLDVPSDTLAWTESTARWSGGADNRLSDVPPAWARTHTPEEYRFMELMRNPFGLADSLRAFYVKREQEVLVVVDSEHSDNLYREEKNKNHASFSVGLSTPLVNVVRLELESVSLSTPPFTVSNVYGGNFMVLEPKTLGLARHADDRFRVYLSIDTGSYSGTQAMIDALNASVLRASTTSHAFLDWGPVPETTFSYSVSQQQVTMNLQLALQFHQDAFEFQWDPATVWGATVAQYLGFDLASSTCRGLWFPGALQSRRLRAATIADASRNVSRLSVDHTTATVSYFVVVSSTSMTTSDGVSALLKTETDNETENAISPDLKRVFSRKVSLVPRTGRYSFNSLLEAVQQTLSTDAVFGRFSSIRELGDNDSVSTSASAKKTLVLSLVPDTEHADVRGWWHRGENAGRVVMTVDFAYANLATWCDNADGFNFPLFASNETRGIARVVPSLMDSVMPYVSLSYSVPSSQSNLPGVADLGVVADFVRVVGGGGSDKDYYINVASGEAFCLANNHGEESVSRVSGMYLRVRDDSDLHGTYGSTLDVFAELTTMKDYSLSSLAMEAQRALQAQVSTGMDNTEVDVVTDAATGNSCLRFRVDVARTLGEYQSVSISLGAASPEGSLASRFFPSSLSSPPPAVTDNEPTNGKFRFFTVDEPGVSPGTSYVLGSLDITFRGDTDPVGITVTIEDNDTQGNPKSYSNLYAAIAAFNAKLADTFAQYIEFGNLLSGSELAFAGTYYTAANDQRYRLELTLRATKLVSETMFDLILCDKDLWTKLGFSDAHRLRMSLRDSQETTSSNNGIVRAHVQADVGVSAADSTRLRLEVNDTREKVTVARLRVRGSVSTAPEPFSVAVYGLDATNDIYTLDLTLDTNKDLSVEAIVDSLNAQIAVATSTTPMSAKGKIAPLFQFTNDTVKHRVSCLTLYTQRFDTRDFDLVTYSPQLFSQCQSRRGVVSAGHRFSLGYMLGFSENVVYDLSQESVLLWNAEIQTPVARVTGKTGVGVSAGMTDSAFCLLVDDMCISRPQTTVINTEPPRIDSNNEDSTFVTKSRRTAAACGLGGGGASSSSSDFNPQFNLAAVGGSRYNMLTLNQMYAASVFIQAKRQRVEAINVLQRQLAMAGDQYAYEKGALRDGDVSASALLSGRSASLDVQNNLMTKFSLPVNSVSQRVVFCDANGNRTVRVYAGPVKLTMLRIALTDMYGAPVPLTNKWTLQFRAFCIPSSKGDGGNVASETAAT